MTESNTTAGQRHDAVLRTLEGRRAFQLAIEASEISRALAFERIAAKHPGESRRETVIIRKSRPFSQMEFNRRIEVDRDGPLSIATAEDLIIAKVE